MELKKLRDTFREAADILDELIKLKGNKETAERVKSHYLSFNTIMTLHIYDAYFFTIILLHPRHKVQSARVKHELPPHTTAWRAHRPLDSGYWLGYK